MEHVFCTKCGKQIDASDQHCNHCGSRQEHIFAKTQSSRIPSGNEVPEGVKGWSWGAFWLCWIWSIFNKTWIGLLALIPVVNIVMFVVLGVKGREWAWKNKNWDNIEHFNRVQRRWSIAGWIFVATPLFLIGLAAAYSGLNQQAAINQDKNGSSPRIEGIYGSDINREITPTSPTAMALSPYELPTLKFKQIDLVGEMNRAGFDPHWNTQIIKYLANPDDFWNICVIQESHYAQTSGMLAKSEAQTWGANACRSVVNEYFQCLNNMELDQSVMCLQSYISNLSLDS